MPPCRVLIVDDNTHIHRDFQKIVDTLESTSWSLLIVDPLGPEPPSQRTPEFELGFAESGEAALRMVGSAVSAGQPFQIAFVDMRMPGLDGLATVEKLWQLQPHLEVAFSSAYMDHSWNSVIERLRRPGLRMVPKPWKGSDIIAVLHELRGRMRTRSLRAGR
jgi:CheY-like chemotaxis protein